MLQENKIGRHLQDLRVQGHPLRSHLKRELEHCEQQVASSCRPHIQLGGLQRHHEASLGQSTEQAKGVA